MTTTLGKDLEVDLRASRPDWRPERLPTGWLASPAALRAQTPPCDRRGALAQPARTDRRDDARGTQRAGDKRLRQPPGRRRARPLRTPRRTTTPSRPRPQQ